jgi:hypothetical protein
VPAAFAGTLLVSRLFARTRDVRPRHYRGNICQNQAKPGKTGGQAGAGQLFASSNNEKTILFFHFMDFQSSPLQKQEIRDCPDKRHLLSLNHSTLSFAIMALCQGQKTPIQPTGRNKHEY